MKQGALITIQLCVIGAVSFVLAACTSNVSEHEPDRFSQQPAAGGVEIAVVSVAPWKDYAASLGPRFTLKGDDAVKQAIPRTAILSEALSQEVGFSLNLGLPTADSSPAKPASSGQDKSPNPSQGGQQSAGSAQEQSPNKSQPDSNQAAAAGASAGQLVSADPLLQYAAATALFQEVQLLNRYVIDAARRHNYRAYVVRLQITVTPFALHEPYDVYTDISFFPIVSDEKKCEAPASAPKRHDCYYKADIIPLLVTDSLEGALESESEESVRKLVLALSFIHSGVTGSAGLNDLQTQIQSALGTDLNSVLSVGRLNDDTIEVRLGAARQGPDRVMIPQNHYITVLLMVQSEFVGFELSKGSSAEKSVDAVAYTIMRDPTMRGMPLPQQPLTDRAVAAVNALKRHFPNGVVPCVKPAAGQSVQGSCVLDDADLRALADKLLGDVYTDNYPKFDEDLEPYKRALKLKRQRLPYERDMWSEIVEGLRSSEFSATRFELPNDPGIQMPTKDQPLLARDDGRTMTVVVDGAGGLVGDDVTAILTFQTKTGALPIPAESVAASGQRLTIAFPSVADWKVTDLELQNGRLIGGKLDVSYFDRWNANGKWQRQTFSKVFYHHVAGGTGSKTTGSNPELSTTAITTTTPTATTTTVTTTTTKPNQPASKRAPAPASKSNP